MAPGGGRHARALLLGQDDAPQRLPAEVPKRLQPMLPELMSSLVWESLDVEVAGHAPFEGVDLIDLELNPLSLGLQRLFLPDAAVCRPCARCPLRNSQAVLLRKAAHALEGRGHDVDEHVDGLQYLGPPPPPLPDGCGDVAHDAEHRDELRGWHLHGPKVRKKANDIRCARRVVPTVVHEGELHGGRPIHARNRQHDHGDQRHLRGAAAHMHVQGVPQL
mmetsp:Transcript_117975/g.376133  ORF Transcript_117975/g.376133 Transcript_117975/m.376133 type:complete len:219 (-) Transcript_117975:1935-2591(-)